MEGEGFIFKFFFCLFMFYLKLNDEIRNYRVKWGKLLSGYGYDLS